MPTKYCSKCGSKSEYTVKPPKFCGSCAFEYSKAFISASTPISSNPEPINKVLASAPKRKRPTENTEEIDDESFDENEVWTNAQELIASVRKDIIVRPAQSFGVRLGDILQNPDKYSDIGQRSFEQLVQIEPSE